MPDEQLTEQQMVERLYTEIERGKAFFRATQPSIADDVIEERVLKALEPWMARWMQRSSAGHVRGFLDLAKSRLTTSRTGIVPEVNGVIARLQHWDARLRLIAGDVAEVTKTADGFRIKIKKMDLREEIIEPSLIVCCLGANTDFSRSSNPIWDRLIARGLAQPHPKTGRGIFVDAFGALVRADGSISERVLAVGPMRQGDEIERNGRIGAFVFSIGTIRNQALLAALRILWLTENLSYSSMDAFARTKMDGLCEAIYSDAKTENKAKCLSNSILAARLSGVAKRLSPGRELEGGAVDGWLQRHLQDILADISLPRDADPEAFKHALWYRAHLEAAKTAIDIRRLADEHHRLRKYGAETQTEFLDERLACSSLLRASVGVFGAATGSLLIYSPADQKLFPFAMYRRVESFTPTAYGEGVAGALVRSFFEAGNATTSDGVQLYLDAGRVVGAFVRDYNKLQQQLKKGSYIRHERRFPSVLVSILTDRQLLGVVYIETDKAQSFDCEDAKLLAAIMSTNFEMMKAAQRGWDRRPLLSYRFGDFERAALDEVNLSRQDLSQAVFRYAEMRRANLERAMLTGTNFDFADLREARMNSATVIGASFSRANLVGCILDGADINYSTFAGSDLSRCRIAGATVGNCSFEGANMSDVALRDLNISSLNFSGAVMRRCVFANLTGTEKAVWRGVDLLDCRMDRPFWQSLPEIVREVHSHRVQIDG